MWTGRSFKSTAEVMRRLTPGVRTPAHFRCHPRLMGRNPGVIFEFILKQCSLVVAQIWCAYRGVVQRRRARIRGISNHTGESARAQTHRAKCSSSIVVQYRPFTSAQLLMCLEASGIHAPFRHSHTKAMSPKFLACAIQGDNIFSLLTDADGERSTELS